MAGRRFATRGATEMQFFTIASIDHRDNLQNFVTSIVRSYSLRISLWLQSMLVPINYLSIEWNVSGPKRVYS